MLKKIVNASKTSSSILMLILSIFAFGCWGQTEEQSLQSLRNFARDGKNPPEEVVTQVERRFAGRRTGVLAKLLHAKIKFDNKDFAGAAALLASDDFGRLTNVADHALYGIASAIYLRRDVSNDNPAALWRVAGR